MVIKSTLILQQGFRAHGMISMRIGVMAVSAIMGVVMSMIMTGLMAVVVSVMICHMRPDFLFTGAGALAIGIT